MRSEPVRMVGRPADPRRRAEMEAEFGGSLKACSGSVRRACERCETLVWMGPRQQEAEEGLLVLGVLTVVLCFDCAIRDLPETGGGVLMHLGNPEGRVRR